MLRLLLLLLSSLLLVGSVAAAAGLRLAAPPFREVLVARQMAAAGGEQSLTVTLDQQAATTTILRLTITYPGGATQEVLDQTFGSTATLTWQVPAGAAPGEASFRLVTSGCGCGDRSSATLAADREYTLDGAFFVTD